MVLFVGFDPSFAALGSTEQRRPPEREPDSSRITPTTEPDVASPDSRRRLNSPEATPRPTRIAFTAKFGPDEDGFPLQLVSGDQLRGAESFDPQVIVENRISQDSQTALLQAQESRDAVADETRRQQESAADARRDDTATASDRTETETPEPDESRADSGAFVDLEV